MMFFRKVNFRKYPLRVCTMATITGTREVKPGYSYTEREGTIKPEYQVVSKRILTNDEGCFWYDPRKGKKNKYSFGYGNNVAIGATFILSMSKHNIEKDPEIVLTEEEKRTGKISFQRISDLEMEINS